jgi:predicted class III extradiol MEMO1 family dioxygenase
MNILLKCIFLISDIYSGSEFPFSYWTDERQEDLRLVPILVGQASAQQGAQLVKVLEPYFKDPETYFIISSDFCHWYVTPFLSFQWNSRYRGTRFNCTPYYPNPPPTPNPVPPVSPHTQPAAFQPPEMVKRFSSSVSKAETPIWRSIEYMDHEGMDLLRTPGSEGAVEKWEAYLATTKVSACFQGIC